MASFEAAATEKQQELLERAEDILHDLQEITAEEHALDGRVADNAETPTVAEGKENDEGLIMKKGCEDHQEGHEWGTSEHDNCYCQLEAPDLFRFCYHVDCLPGSEIVRDSKGLWDCPGGFSTADSSEKRADMSMLEDSLLQILTGNELEVKLTKDLLKRQIAKAISQETSGVHLIMATAYVEEQTASVILLSVFLVLRSKLTPKVSGHRFAVEFGVFTGVVGLVGFLMDRVESAQTTQQLNEIQGQLNEIQGQIRELDRKIDDLTRSVSDLQLGQQYLQQVSLYGRDERRLKNVLDTLSRMRISNGQYAGSDIQGWADSVLSHGSDGSEM
ncbi:hypothetical protein Bbelb_235260 [Branchiostoma belcheri]|nr:hypothetical protein Bbelb_235260 [Branchiostoma belcheri]